uniref:Uncharacterized protein n=1 Tax=Caudovirales sp. ctNZz8 TaxID=2826772 RepID=A0A8S5QYR1_9CAUD|nr:MAG TPA: hypothetical protein [Caudovirales sp. ctNZz8]
MTYPPRPSRARRPQSSHSYWGKIRAFRYAVSGAVKGLAHGFSLKCPRFLAECPQVLFSFIPFSLVLRAERSDKGAAMRFRLLFI